MTDPFPVPQLEPRSADSHKGDYGRVLIVGGSRGMSGAIALAGMAALRSGSGLVTLAVPDSCLETVAGFEPAYMTVALDEDSGGRIAGTAREDLVALAATCDCVAIGPGMGQSHELVELVEHVYRALPQPIVVDADGLNALAKSHEPSGAPRGARVLTPHPGEFQRLSPGPTQSARERAIEFAAQYQLVLVLKGRRTLVTNGQRSARNETGNPGMATGGAGDVLTGIVASLLGQGWRPAEAARLGAHVHGLAGDLAAASVGQTSLTASDIVGWLPNAFQSLTDPGKTAP